MSLLTSDFPDVCDIYKRRVRRSDSVGGNKKSLETVSTGVLCWVQKVSSSEARDFQQRGINVSKKVYFASDPSLTERNQIVITSLKGSSIVEANREFLDVVSVDYPDASNAFGLLWKVMVSSLTSSKDNIRG